MNNLKEETYVMRNKNEVKRWLETLNYGQFSKGTINNVMPIRDE